MVVLPRLVALMLLLTCLSVSIPSYAQSIQVVDMYYRITPPAPLIQITPILSELSNLPRLL
jgi:hypothetical protein